MRVTLFKILLYLVVCTIPGTTLGNMVMRRHFDGFGDNYLPYGGIGVPTPPIQSLLVPSTNRFLTVDPMAQKRHEIFSLCQVKHDIIS